MLDSLQKEVKIPFARIQSPSSINTYKQCPRKYYYQYIEKLPTRPNIHLTRGKIVHTVLEHFFKVDVSKLPEENAFFVLQVFINDMMEQYWQRAQAELEQMHLTKPQLDFYFVETKEMVNSWYANFLRKLTTETKQYPFVQAFQRLTPRAEVEYGSGKYGIRGFIDAVHERDGEVILMDYKTSKHPKISNEYRLQLALYALMYGETHKRLPDKVGIDFLKFGEQLLPVDNDLITHAKCEAELIHINTTTIVKGDYSMKPSPLCKWSTGQCDFYEKCFQ